jgi:twinkle protein
MCDSSDAYSEHEDGTGYCFSCNRPYKPGAEQQEPSVKRPDWVSGACQELENRRIPLQVCERYGYKVGTYKSEVCHVATYNWGGRQVAQHLRLSGKRFLWLGEAKQVELFGQHLFRGGNHSKVVYITEGEIDCMSVATVLGVGHAVVSVPSGTGSAVKAVLANLAFLSEFDKVVLNFDSDEPGRQTAEAVAQILPVGRAYTVTMPLKDANEMLVANRGNELRTALLAASRYRPSGIVTPAQLAEDAMKAPETGLPWAWQGMTDISYGRRQGETHVFGAGTGVGKTAMLLSQIHYDLFTLNERVGAVLMETDPALSLQMIAGIHAKRLFHIPAARAGWTQEELNKAVHDVVENENLFLINYWGASEWSELQARIRYLVHGEGCRLIYVDHLTALAAGRGDKESERECLEQLMAEAAKLAVETNHVLHLVSHLATPEGRPHEEGGHVSLRHFKGSRAIGFWSSCAWGLERNTLHRDPDERMTTKVTCLKARKAGWNTGRSFELRFDPHTGTLSEQVDEDQYDPASWDERT